MSRPAQRYAVPVKVNLFLEVLGKRPDGFHELLTVFDALAIGDTLVLEEAEQLEVLCEREDVPDGDENLVGRILRAAERELGRELPLRITIEKRFPPGTGLGAGSADAAIALRAALAWHGAVLDDAMLTELCAEVGSDVAFFLEGGCALGLGRGEQLSPIAATAPRHYVVVTGAPSVATAEVFGALPLSLGGQAPEVGPLLEALVGEQALPRELLYNRLEPTAMKVAPEHVRFAKRLASAAGGATPMLAGSGGAWFFVVEDEAAALTLADQLRDALKEVQVSTAPPLARSSQLVQAPAERSEPAEPDTP